MAEINHAEGGASGKGVTQFAWPAATESDTFEAVQPGASRTLAGCLQIIGDLGGATVALQGSNDGTNYHTLKDLQGNDAELSAAGLIEFTTSALWLKIDNGSGSSQSITANLVLRG